MSHDVDVLVVGAGPTGLMLAYELKLGGATVAVIERDSERSKQSKALNLQPRTAEVLDMRGLLDELLPKASGRIADGHFAMLAEPLRFDGWRTRFNHQVGIPQARTAETIEAAVADVVYRGSTLRGLTRTDEQVIAHLDGRDDMRGRWLVAADGGRSTVRKTLGTPFDGRDGRVSMVVADITISSGAEFIPTGFSSVRDVYESVARGVPMISLGDGVYRLLLAGNRQQRAEKDEPVTADEVRESLTVGYGDAVTLGELRFASRFSDANRQVRHYRDDRVFYAGDAAHIHLPAGGQGLNLGMQDAFNLGWKLAAVIRGDADESLLDSYHTERHPVGARVLHNTRAQGALVGLKGDPDGDALRETFTSLLEFDAVNDYLTGMLSGLDITYSIACEHELAGQRILDYDLADGGRVFERMRTGEWTVVRATEVPELPAEVVLVRPDGYVHWVGHEADLDEAMATRFGVARVSA